MVPEDSQAAGGTAAGGTPAGGTAVEDRAAGGTAVEDRAAVGRAAGGRAAVGRAAAGRLPGGIVVVAALWNSLVVVLVGSCQEGRLKRETKTTQIPSYLLYNLYYLPNSIQVLRNALAVEAQVLRAR